MPVPQQQPAIGHALLDGQQVVESGVPGVTENVCTRRIAPMAELDGLQRQIAPGPDVCCPSFLGNPVSRVSAPPHFMGRRTPPPELIPQPSPHPPPTTPTP